MMFDLGYLMCLHIQMITIRIDLVQICHGKQL